MFFKRCFLSITAILAVTFLSFSALADNDSPTEIRSFAQGMDTVVLAAGDVPDAVQSSHLNLNSRALVLP